MDYVIKDKKGKIRGYIFQEFPYLFPNVSTLHADFIWYDVGSSLERCKEIANQELHECRIVQP